jgi:hypothetical protein
VGLHSKDANIMFVKGERVAAAKANAWRQGSRGQGEDGTIAVFIGARNE